MKRKRTKYFKKYMHERYHSDKEFREKVKKLNKDLKRKKVKNWRKKNLCIICGGKRDSKYFKSCNKCRAVLRDWAMNKYNSDKIKVNEEFIDKIFSRKEKSLELGEVDA